MSEQRLQKFMSAAGVASRRQSERLITEGRVKVNGEVVTKLGTRVTPGRDQVQVDGMMVSYDPRSVYLLLYKPTRVISSVTDPEGREVVTDLIPESYGRVYPVGRLDWNSEGAVLMTNDGQLTQYLTHPKYEVTKVYMVKTDGLVSNDDRRIDILREGVRLDDGYVTQPAEVVRDSDTGRHTWFVVGIAEGRNRQVRRMFEAVGIDVRKLKRIAYGPVLLGDMLPGDFRRLGEHEIDDLYEAAGQTRGKLQASRGRLHTSLRNRAARNIEEYQSGPTRRQATPEGLGLEGNFSKAERNIMQRHARAAREGAQAGDAHEMSNEPEQPRSRPGDWRRNSSNHKRRKREK